MESTPQYRLSHDQLNNIVQNLLKISKRNCPLHPCQQRTRYANLLQWLITAMTGLKQSILPPREVADRQQQAVVTVLSELIQLTRKECSQKSVILEMVLQYLISTLNSYWNAFQNSTKEMSYQYQHHTVRIEREYVAQIKRLQLENEEMRRDKQHRWRNMFMLIKDNRIYRKRNKKLLKSVRYQMQRGYGMGEQLIALQGENEKLKAKLSYLQQRNINVQDYVQVNIRLAQLQDRVRVYPKKSRRVLKNELMKIEIEQIKNLNQKIKFIIRAIEETGEIIDQIYDEETNWKNFQYNISTQTTNSQEDKATNTPSIRLNNAETVTYNHEHLELSLCDTVQVKVKLVRPEKKQTSNRQSKNVMFMSQSYGKLNLGVRKEENRSRHVSKRAERKEIFSVCQSLRITIFQGRISYISTYNTEIFNGIRVEQDMESKVLNEKKIQIESKTQKKLKAVEMSEVECQTEQEQNKENNHFALSRSLCKTQINISNKIATQSRIRLNHCNSKSNFLQIVKQMFYCFDPTKRKSNRLSGFKLTPREQKGLFYIPPILQQIDSENEMTDFKQSQKQKKQKQKQQPIDIKTSMRRVGKIQNRNQQKQQIKNVSENKIEIVKLTTVDSNVNSRIGESQKQRDSLVQQQSIINKSPSEMKTTKHGSESRSEIMTPQQIKQMRKQLKNKHFSNTAQTVNQNQQPQTNSRNTSAIFSQQQLRKLQSKHNEKREFNHKRAITQINELQVASNINQQIKMVRMNQKPKQLHRISEEIEQLGEERKLQKINAGKDKLGTLLPFLVSKQAQISVKDIDFSKGIQKILRNIDIRSKELLANNYTLKSYLTSYFKCLYGKELYSNFLSFLFNSIDSGQQLWFCLSRLSNSRLPEGYLIDLFKTFILMINKCYLTNQSPTSQSIRPDLLRYMISLYYQEAQVDSFTARMNHLSCRNLSGWFNCLQLELRQKAIGSQLYHFLSQILTEVENTVTFQFLEELNFFQHNDEPLHDKIIIAKLSLHNNVPLHRLCLICLRLDWTSMLDIQDSIESAYLSKIGIFNRNNSLKQVQNYLHILSQFKNIERCIKYELLLNQIYRQQPKRHLLMICELTAMQYMLRRDFPLSKELKFINLAFQGIQKKLIYKDYRERLEGEGQMLRNQSLA